MPHADPFYIFRNIFVSVVCNLKAQGIYPTEARVCKLMTKPGGLRNKKVRAAFHNARTEIGL